MREALRFLAERVMISTGQQGGLNFTYAQQGRGIICP